MGTLYQKRTFSELQINDVLIATFQDNKLIPNAASEILAIADLKNKNRIKVRNSEDEAIWRFDKNIEYLVEVF
jgi:hypothetical protein